MNRLDQTVYRGKVFDQLKSLPAHYTRFYATYLEAQQAAERLAKKYYPSRACIAVLQTIRLDCAIEGKLIEQ